LVLPGFDGLRVPTRFWMLGTLCLAMAAALGLDRLAPHRPAARFALVMILSCGVLADSWLGEVPMGEAPIHWTAVEQPSQDRAVLELPLGPGWDAAATFRAVGHGRRVVNGVSGYEPPHYPLLQRGLEARDASVLLALSSFGPIDVVVDGAEDQTRELERYVSAFPGAQRLASDGVRTAYRMPEPPSGPVHAGTDLAVVIARSCNGSTEVGLALDGDVATAWTQKPQIADACLEVDLATTQTVGGVTQALGKTIDGYPRQLAVDLSIDGHTWQTVWEGSGLGPTLLSLMKTPRDVRLVIHFDARPARFVRLRLLTGAEASWNVAELRIHAP